MLTRPINKPDIYDLETSIGYRLHVTSRVHEKRLDEVLAAIGLTRGEFALMFAVGRAGQSTPSDIAYYLQVERPAVSRLLNILKEKGHVFTGGASRDRRVQMVALTNSGFAKLEEGMNAALALNDRIWARLGPERAAQLMQLLDEIRGPERVKIKAF